MGRDLKDLEADSDADQRWEYPKCPDEKKDLIPDSSEENKLE